MIKVTLPFLVLIATFLAGCGSSVYLTRYDTYLLNSTSPSLPLQLKDDKFEFDFTPLKSGVCFSIKNLTNKLAFLEWDRCYFIDPAGSSSKAVNTDLLQENTETAQKTLNESPIPSNGALVRFTSSALNLSQSTYLNVNSSNRSNNSDRYSSYNGDTYGSHASNEVTDMRFAMQKAYLYSNYWPSYQDLGETSKSLDEISDYILNNNSMGLGLSIKVNDSIMDYKFDFRFKKVSVYKDMNLIKSASESTGWKWE